MSDYDLRVIGAGAAGLAAARAGVRAGRRVVTANLVFTAAIVTVLVVWNPAAYHPLPRGVAGHESSAVLDGLNGLRLLSRRAGPTPRAAAGPEPSTKP